MEIKFLCVELNVLYLVAVCNSFCFIVLLVKK